MGSLRPLCPAFAAVIATFWDGDAQGRQTERRDRGMAELASFLVSRLEKGAACLWAHDAHIAHAGNTPQMGSYLAELLAGAKLRYYAVGFYVAVGSTRAWDRGGKIRVISHAIPAARDYMVEHAVLALAGNPAVACLPLRGAPPALTAWLQVPRFVRELGWGYETENALRQLRDIPASFDALVVIRGGHDSTPTPTGPPKAK